MMKYLRPDLVKEFRLKKSKPKSTKSKRNTNQVTASQLEALKNKFNVK